MKKLLFSILAIFMGGVVATVPVASVFADCTITTVLGDTKCDKDSSGNITENKNSGTYNCVCDDGSGSGTTHILNLVLDIMSIAIGVLAVIGISVVGVQYLTSGGNEEKARKAKRRMVEIVIGIVVYVLLFAIMEWLF